MQVSVKERHQLLQLRKSTLCMLGHSVQEEAGVTEYETDAIKSTHGVGDTGFQDSIKEGAGKIGRKDRKGGRGCE